MEDETLEDIAGGAIEAEEKELIEDGSDDDKEEEAKRAEAEEDDAADDKAEDGMFFAADDSPKDNFLVTLRSLSLSTTEMDDECVGGRDSASLE